MPTPIPTSPYGERIESALAFAFGAYRHDKRLWADPSFLARLFGITSLVLESGASEAEAIASLLVRAVDRRSTGSQLADIREEFGEHVSAIVEGCLDVVDPDGSRGPLYDRITAAVERYRARYARTQDPLDAAGILLVSSAATYYDARLAADRLRLGDDHFETFPGKKFGTLWAYRTLADAYEASASDAAAPHARFAGLTRDLVEAMAGKPVTSDELRAAFAIDATIEAREKGALMTSNEGA